MDRERRGRPGSGVENVDVLDLVTHDPKTDEYALIMVESRPWEDTPERLEELQSKINNYLSFALDGQLVAKYPGAAGKAVRIQLDCSSSPLGKIAEFLTAVGEALRREGVGFVIKLL